MQDSMRRRAISLTAALKTDSMGRIGSKGGRLEENFNTQFSNKCTNYWSVGVCGGRPANGL